MQISTLQAIAALNKALEADPNSLEVLLSLGVSHTNELDAGELCMTVFQPLCAVDFSHLLSVASPFFTASLCC